MESRIPILTPTQSRIPIMQPGQKVSAPTAVAEPSIKVVQAQPTQKIVGVVQADSKGFGPTASMPAVAKPKANPVQNSNLSPEEFHPANMDSRIPILPKKELSVSGVDGTPTPVPTKQAPTASATPDSSTASLLPQTFQTVQKTPDEIAWQDKTRSEMIKDLIKSPIKDLIVTPGVRFTQAVASIYPEFANAVNEKQTVHFPLLGDISVEGQKSGMSGAKQIAGQGLSAASWLYAPEKVIGIGRNILNDVAISSIKEGVNITDSLVRDALWNTVKKSAAQGAIIGSAGNLGSSLQGDGKWTDNAKDFVIGGLFGAAFGATVAGGGAALRIAANKTKFIQQTLLTELVDRGLTPEHAQKLVSEGGFLGNVFGKLNPRAEELGNTINVLNKRWVEKPTPANKKALDLAKKEYKLATQGGYVKNPFASESPEVPRPQKQPELGSQQTPQLSKEKIVSYEPNLAQLGSSVKQRGFITSLKANPETSEIFKDIVDNYNPHVNKEDIANVRALSIMEPDKYGSLVRSSDTSAESTIAKVMYTKDAVKLGQIDEAKSMAKILANRGTEMGQAVQAYKTLGADLGDPVKALVLAQKELGKSGVDMTDDLAGKIVKQAEVIQQLPKESKYEKFVQTKNLMKIISDNIPTDLGEVAKNVFNVPRTIMSSMDLSFGLRQGLVAAYRHPILFSKAFGTQFKMFAAEKAYGDVMNLVLNNPDYEWAKKMGVSFTDLGGHTSTAEEQFMSNYAERIPLIGNMVRASGRAYTGMANKLRMDIFSSLMNDAERLGLSPRENADLSSGVARVVNDITGRGTLNLGILGNYEKSAPLLNTVFFSPRLMMSRLSLLTSPVSYLNADPFVRKEALKSMLAYGSATATILGLAKLSGLGVSVDPRNSDFGKIKIGNTRLDIMGGFQQYIRMAAQVISGKYISSTTGKEYTLGEGYKPLTRLDIVGRQLESKEAPVISFITDWLRGTDYTGDKVTLTSSLQKRLTPMIIQDMTDLYNDDPNLLPLGLVGSFGIGLQTYSQKPTKSSNGRLANPSSTGSSRLPNPK